MTTINNPTINKLGVTTCLALAASSASAGGLDLSGQSILPLFERGTYAEFTVVNISPDVSGIDATGQPTGNINEGFVTYGGALKTDVTEQLSLALIWDQPFYGRAHYGGGLFSGLEATIETNALTLATRYKFNERFSIHGGLRAQHLTGTLAFPLLDYTLDSSTETDMGYMVGAAYEIPEYHALLALTYHSGITQKLEATESGVNTGTYNVEWPESYTLDFRAPISQSTLLFGSIRYTDWTVFDIRPPVFSADGTPIFNLEDSTTTYKLGVAQAFNDTWSGHVRLTYEPSSDDEQLVFNPTNGTRGVGLGVSYQPDRLRISVAADYFELKGTSGAFGNFDDGSAVAVGMQVGYHF